MKSARPATRDAEIGLATGISALPRALDPARGAAVVATLDPGLQTGRLGDLLHGAAGSSPYLARLMTREGDWLAGIAHTDPHATLNDLIHVIRADFTSLADIRVALRQAKARAALLIALADLGGVWDLQQVTGALTLLADAAVEAAARHLLGEEIRRNRLPGMTEADLDTGAGYVLLAMGKMGAGELNYSSDIDLIALFDDSRFDNGDVLDAKARYIHVTKQLVKLLSENIAGGYVFRTDLRLRPSPSTTPVCMAISAAERYYESVGRTWERAAHIKARPLVDRKAGAAYLAELTPFIWRRYLDFAAIEDTQEMLRKIRAQKVRFAPGALPGYDLKLGPGGIREIEFFAQTRQLICGGRDASLRVATTRGALDALVEGGWITSRVRDDLWGDYVLLRTVEHRLQMIEDAQTHAIPRTTEARARLAALAGAGDVATFERHLVDRLAHVHATCDEFFATPDRESAPTHDLASLGFERPEDAARQIARWRDGAIPATRSERARALFRGLEGQIVTRLGRAARPDHALIQFDRFLSGLPAGVQVFSLFSANPQLLDLIVEICAAAPRLAAYLGRRSRTLDALLDRDFWEPLPDAATLARDLGHRIGDGMDYQDALDETRRWAREAGFRAGLHVLRGHADAVEAGVAFSAIAEAALSSLLPRVIDDFSSRHGPPPGNGLAVLAMGKLGSGEMTAGSDLDLIIVYDPDGVEASEGPRPLSASAYYPRLTQALVSALTAPTAEGALYEVDMRLRPSGRKGPVAVSLAAFTRYQTQEAWVWEHMALTRARVIAGPEALRQRIGTAMTEALAARMSNPAVLTEAGEMRARILDATASDRANPWALKHAAGGLMEIEFLTQTGVLFHGLAGVRQAGAALEHLAETGWIDPTDARTLGEAHALCQHLQQIERVALDQPLDPAALGPDLEGILARAGGVDGFAALERKLQTLQARAADICRHHLSLPAKDT